MQFQFDNDQPIYLQAASQIRQEIVSGRLEKGQKIPSVRELAIMAQINPNTMQKALSFLENEGLISTRRTSGKYVTEDDVLLLHLRQAYAMECTRRYLADMSALGLEDKQIDSLLMLCRKEHGTS